MRVAGVKHRGLPLKKTEPVEAGRTTDSDGELELKRRVHENQRALRANLAQQYDFVICGAGSSGSVIARRLAENPSVSVLLLEAGGDDDIPNVMSASDWATNIGSERDWAFHSEPDPAVNGRSLLLSMGKILGGGSSINAMIWARGHQDDWDFFASEARDPAWNYESVLGIYKRIENWSGDRDPHYRGTDGPVYVAPAPHASTALAVLDGGRTVGIPTFANQNGRMMEAATGAAICDLRRRGDRRQSVFRSYTFPFMDRANLTVLSGALVHRVNFQGARATGVEFWLDGKTYIVAANLEVILSLGAIHTPKVLMQSGIGDRAALQRFDITPIQHLPGVGRNFQDHTGFDCVWESADDSRVPDTTVEATLFCRSDSSLATPDLQICYAGFSKGSSENTARFALPTNGWVLFGGLQRPRSRGQIHLTGDSPSDPVRIQANFLSDPADLRAAIECVEICRSIGNSAPLRRFARREVMPGNLKGKDLERFVRDAAVTYWHEAGTAKMGYDATSVVDGSLRVHGIERLRVADASIMPRITTGNTMAPCVVIGERAAELLRSQHSL
jgi:choline dehydrogenase